MKFGGFTFKPEDADRDVICLMDAYRHIPLGRDPVGRAAQC